MQPVTALALLALLAACGQGNRQPSTHASGSASGGYARPASYDPPGPSHDPWGPWIREASRRFDVPERWIREVMRQESGGRAGATSPVGAMGLMQVMPGTYAELRSRHGLGDDPYHPYDSIMAGTAYLRQMYDLYGSPAFLAAYNAGPRRLEDYLWNNRGLPTETRNYVARIGPQVIAHHPNRRVAPEIYAAAEIPVRIPAGPRRMDSATMLALREQRDAQQPGIQLAQLPAGPVVRMDPIPDGSTSPAYQASAAPVQLASLGGGGYGGVVRMDPIPDGSTPEGAARIAEADGHAAAETFSPAPMPAPVAMAAPMPSHAPTLAPPVRAASAAPVAVRPPVPTRLAFTAPPPARPQPMLVANLSPPVSRQVVPAARPGSLGLISAAQANPLPAALRPALASTGASTSWGVQVGAFSSENLARSAANPARGTTGAGSRAVVLPLPQGRNTLYRARVTGLSQAAAQAACERLRARGGCMLLSPDAPG
ncbi:transglycosylase SLT domain-containing protein [Siccirubricoccus sp. G192]|uniref:transglycosylase SLT domain-containing protein n=1 Tax=Siccirubricoccus sp. G192 TaxID=2849651 RepID=UPI0020C59F9A|nr:transglycosylase SLT domain-containing protein [Siccirubricoccus sp. G192]